MEKAINGEVAAITVQLSYKETQAIEREEKQAAEISKAAIIEDTTDAPF